MKKAYYKFPGFGGRNGHLQSGYVSIEIKNGFGEVNADNADQVALAKAHNGTLDKEIPPKKSKKQVIK